MTPNLNDYNNFSISPSAILSVIMISVIFALIFYLLQSFGLFNMAKTKNIENPWLAFIPYANTYIYGKIAFEEKFKTILLITLRVLAFAFALITSVDSFASALNGSPQIHNNTNIFQIVYVIFNFYTTYKVYKQFSNKAVVMLVFSVLSCGLLIPVFLFAIRNNKLKTLENQN